MKTKRIELDVDLIGEQIPLSVEEQKALSDFFKKRNIEKVVETTSHKKSKSEKPASKQEFIKQLLSFAQRDI